MEKCIIISQSEAMVLLPLLKNSIDKLYTRTAFPFANIEVLEQLRSDYQNIVDKLEVAFNG